MKVKMKLYEKMAIETGKRYKQWDYIIPAKESYLQAVQDVLDLMNDDTPVGVLKSYMSEEVEVEFKDGEHQLYGRDK